MADDAAPTAKTGSWWTTLPGLLTAAAAVITALTGLVTVLVQTSTTGRRTPPQAVAEKEKPASNVPTEIGVKPPLATPANPANEGAPAATVASAESSNAATNAATNAARNAASTSTPTGGRLARAPYKSVRITRRDGRTIEVGDDFQVSIYRKLDLKSGQSIDFDRIARIDVVDIRDVYSPATARIRLVDGRVLEEKFDPYAPLAGHNDLGDFNARWPEVATVEFVR